MPLPEKGAILDRLAMRVIPRTTVKRHDESTFTTPVYEDVQTGPMRVNFAIPSSFQQVPGRQPRALTRVEQVPHWNKIAAVGFTSATVRNAGNQIQTRTQRVRPTMGAYNGQRTVYDAPETTSYSNTVRAPNTIYNILG
jgi:hypothetical protein